MSNRDRIDSYVLIVMYGLIECIFFSDPLVSDMRNALAHLIAVVLGCPPQSSHLWYHMFAPEDLANSYITGFMVSLNAGISIEYSILNQ